MCPEVKVEEKGKAENATFSSGARRSARMPRFELVSYSALLELVSHLELGASRYGEGNWEKGGDDFIIDCMNHLLNHAFEFIRGPVGDQSMEDFLNEHLRGVHCNIHFLAHFKAEGKINPELYYKWRRNATSKTEESR